MQIHSQGNLSIEAALELEAAARTVHSAVFQNEKGDQLDPEGDARLRAGYSARLLELMQSMGARPVHDVVDFGCATGLSTLELMRILPDASFTGIDLSEYFLAVGRYNQRQRETASGKKEKTVFVHGAAEDTGLPAESVDLVSMCLLMHELPQPAARNVMREALRILRPGGTFSMSDMNPGSPAFQRVISNPIVYTAFRSTEPYLDDVRMRVVSIESERLRERREV